MKTFWETILVAFSMFSRVPSKHVEWNEKNQKYSLLAFPLVGVLIGGLWLLVLWLCDSYGLPSLLTAAFLTALPLLVTGGIHMDGYADTVDALSSHQPPERKQEILKDPHAGAFAIMHIAVYYVVWFAAAAVLAEKGLSLTIPLSFVLSRALSALAVAMFPLAKNTGLVHAFAESADKKRVKTWSIVFAVLLSAGIILTNFYGFAALVAAALTFLWFRHVADKEFGGLSGDLSGWFVSKCELYMLVATAVVLSI